MSEPTSVPAPGSIEAQALAELEKEGHEVPGKEQPKTETPKAPEPPKQEEKKEEPQKPADEKPKADEKKPDRTPTMVPAWKLKVAEDQKDTAVKQVAELQAELTKISQQKGPMTEKQKETVKDIKDEIADIFKDNPDIDTGKLAQLSDAILKRIPKGNDEVEKLSKTVQDLQDKRELEQQLNEFSSEFEKDVVPLLKDFDVSGDALSQIKDALKDYAFSETYAKVPLKEIFAIKQSELNLSTPRKSSESPRGVKQRANDAVVDIDNLSEEEFAKLPPEKIEEFMQKKSSGNWKRK